jgi:Arc/MetJ-type ribon-helix-helix transcriptional regulator
VKLSVSLPRADVEFLDEYAHQHRLGSRSAVLQRAVRMLKGSTLERAYEQAWDEWGIMAEAELWEATADDGLTG